eukprot:TRINITY_DN90_c0_g1_i1.p1 TRINITY_DN90_c0_g1~~TRINITY_DN90_c0_g1_i1.p1  ORF type:complete len:116 (+),score=34.25 TRINITY_DN90_c0_g1_i1:82-429(+)
MKFITVFLLAILAFALITEAKTAKHVSKKLKKAPVLMDDDTLSCDCCSEVLNRFKASNLDQINSGFCYSSYDVNDDCFTPCVVISQEYSEDTNAAKLYNLPSDYFCEQITKFCHA